jgi:hypothetical protein
MLRSHGTCLPRPRKAAGKVEAAGALKWGNLTRRPGSREPALGPQLTGPAYPLPGAPVAQANTGGTAQATPVWIPPPLKTIYTFRSKRASARLQKAAIPVSGVLTSRVFFRIRGETQPRKFRKFPRVRKFPVKRYTRGTCRHWAGDLRRRRRRESAGVGIGERRDSAVRPAPGGVGDRNRPYPHRGYKEPVRQVMGVAVPVPQLSR